MAGRDITKTASGACGVNKPLVIELPVYIEQIVLTGRLRRSGRHQVLPRLGGSIRQPHSSAEAAEPSGVR